MKKGIHPNFTECTFVCSCGAEIHTRSIKPNFNIEVCSNCHPFFTGERRFVDTAGRVEKFQKKFGKNWKKNIIEGNKSASVKTDASEKDAGNLAVQAEDKAVSAGSGAEKDKKLETDSE